MEVNKRNFRKVVIGLWASIILNLLFVGVFAGRQLHRAHLMSLHKNVYNRLMQKEEIDAYHEKRQQSEQRIEQAMLKEPYDKQAVLDALNSFDVQMQELRSTFHKRIADEAATLPPEERLKLIPEKISRKGFMESHN